MSIERSLFEGDASFMKARSTVGEFGVLPQHSPMLAVLAPGELRIDKAEGGSEHIFVGGGFVEVLPDRVTVLADIAEHVEEINLERAEGARKSIQDRLADQVPQEERISLEQELVMAEERLRLARLRRPEGPRG